MARWSKVCGSDIVHVSLWPFVPHMIVLNSYAALRDALTTPEAGDALAGRPISPFSKMFNPDNCGTISNYVLTWSNRRLTYQT